MLFECFFNSHFVFVCGKHISFLNACAFGFAVIIGYCLFCHLHSPIRLEQIHIHSRSPVESATLLYDTNHTLFHFSLQGKRWQQRLIYPPIKQTSTKNKNKRFFFKFMFFLKLASLTPLETIFILTNMGATLLMGVLCGV